MLYETDEANFSRRLNTGLFSVLSAPAAYALREKIAARFGPVLLLLTGFVVVLSLAALGRDQLPVENPLIARFFPHVATIAIVVGMALFPRRRAGFAILAFLPGFTAAAFIEASRTPITAQIGLSAQEFFALSLAYNLGLGLALGSVAQWVFDRAPRIAPRLSPDVTLIAAMVLLLGVVGGAISYVTVYLAEVSLHLQHHADVAGDAVASAFRVLRGALITGAIIALALLPVPRLKDMPKLAMALATFVILALVNVGFHSHGAHLLPVMLTLLLRLMLPLNLAILSGLIGLIINAKITGGMFTENTLEYAVESASFALISLGDLILMQKRRQSTLRRQNVQRLLRAQDLSRIGFFVWLPHKEELILDATAHTILSLPETAPISALAARLAPATLAQLTALVSGPLNQPAEINALIAPADTMGRPIMARLHCQAQPLWQGQRAIFGSVVDVTRLYETQEALEQTLTHLQAERAMQAQLFAVISHEMRSPASIIQMLAEGLIENPETGATAGHSIHRLIRHLLAIMEDVRFVMRPEHSPELQTEPVDLSDLLHGMRHDFAPLAEKAGITIAVTCPAQLRLMLDPMRLRQIIGNLTRNAILHSGGRQIRIVATPSHTAKGQMQLTIDIRDDGRGIPLALQPHIFEPFSRAKTGVFSQAEGTGLGMFVVKSLVERMAGRISLTSTPGHGTLFSLTLPVSPVSLAPAAAPAATPGQPLPQSVLLVEDNPLLAELTLARLHRLFRHAETVASAEAAIAAITANPPDIVLTDQNLPGMSGLDLLAHLRAAGFAGKIIALSGSQFDGFDERFHAAGGNGVLTKPFDTRALLGLIAVQGGQAAG